MFSIFSVGATLLLPDGVGSLADSMLSPVRHLIPSRLVVTAHRYFLLGIASDRIDLDQANSEDLLFKSAASPRRRSSVVGRRQPPSSHASPPRPTARPYARSP